MFLRPYIVTCGEAYIHPDTVPADKVHARKKDKSQARNQSEPHKHADRRKDRQSDLKTGKEM
jgi:hypothetical protein